MMSVRIVSVTPPASEPLSLDDVKSFLRVTHDDDNAVILSMITSARQTAELYCRRSFLRTAWKLYVRTATYEDIRIPHGPVQEITQVVSVSHGDPAETVIDSVAYVFSPAFQCLHFKTPRSDDEIRIDYIAGYGDAAEDVPEPLREGMRIHIAALYEGHVSGATIPNGAKYRYNSYRMPRLI